MKKNDSKRHKSCGIKYFTFVKWSKPKYNKRVLSGEIQWCRKERKRNEFLYS